jgi:hypothetical protein
MRDRVGRENMSVERNDAVWLGKMNEFCKELDVFMRCKENDLSWGQMPQNEDGSLKNLCEMSATCVYRSGINTANHKNEIFEIQSRARKILVYMGEHPAMKIFTHYTTGTPFFEKTLFMALALAVEHQDVLTKEPEAAKDNKSAHINHLLEAATTCS